MRVESCINWDWCPYKEIPEEASSAFSHGKTQQKESPSMNQKVGSHQTPNPANLMILEPALDFPACTVRNKVCCLSLACGISVVATSRQTKTHSI